MSNSPLRSRDTVGDAPRISIRPPQASAAPDDLVSAQHDVVSVAYGPISVGKLDAQQAFDLFPSEQSFPSERSSLMFVVDERRADDAPTLDDQGGSARPILGAHRKHSSQRAEWLGQVHRLAPTLTPIGPALRKSMRLLIATWHKVRSNAGRTLQKTRALRSVVDRLAIASVHDVRAAGRHALIVRDRWNAMVPRALGATRMTGQRVQRFAHARRLSIDTGMASRMQLTARRSGIQFAAAARSMCHRPMRLLPASPMTSRLAAGLATVACVTTAAMVDVALFGHRVPFVSVQTRSLALRDLPAAMQPAALSPTPGLQAVALRAAVTDYRPLAVSPFTREPVEPAASPAPLNGARSNAASAQRPQPAADSQAIQRILNRYRDAFSVLDAGAVLAVWPAADAGSLRLDFERLAEQNYQFDQCRISVVELQAQARCIGSAQYTPAGSRRSRDEAREWRFELRRVNDNWRIDTVMSTPPRASEQGAASSRRRP
jgi:hypothetical protein